jgi:hypothetical protein
LASKGPKLLPVDNGMAILRSFGHIDSVIAVIGHTRSGVSVRCVFSSCLFFSVAVCNFLFGTDNVFAISNGLHPCTKGVWMAPEPVEWEGKRVLVLDVEGTGDCDADPASEMALMMVSRLLASVLVYNTKDGPPNRDQLGKLSALAQTSQRMAIKSSQEANQVAFFWLFRDLNLKCDDFQAMFDSKVFGGRSHSEVAHKLREHFGTIHALRMRSPKIRGNVGVDNLSECGDEFRDDLMAVFERLKSASLGSQSPLSTGNDIAEYIRLVSQTSDDVIQVSDLLHTLHVNELMDEAKELFDTEIKFPADESVLPDTAQTLFDQLQKKASANTSKRVGRHSTSNSR